MVSYDDLSSAYPAVIEAAIAADMVGHGFLSTQQTDGGTRSAYEVYTDGAQSVARHGDPIAATEFTSVRGGTFVPAQVFSFWESEIPPFFDRLTSAPDPSGYGDTVAALQGAAERIAALGGGAEVARTVRGFEGRSARHFAAYLDLLDETSQGCAAAVRLVGTELEALGAGWEEFRLGVEGIVAGTEQAFRDVVDGAINPALFFKASSKVAGVLSKVPGPGKVALKGFQAVFKVAEIASKHYDPAPREFELSGGSAEEVWAKVSDAVRHLQYDWVAAERDTVQNQLIDLVALMEREDAGPRPGFRQPDTRGLADATGPGDVVGGGEVDLQALRPQLELAERQLREDLASVYDEAALAIDPGPVRGAFVRGADLTPPLGTSGSYDHVADACRYLQGAMRTTSEALTGSAAVLRAIRLNLDETDATIRQEMNRLADKVRDRYHPGLYADDRREPVT